MFDVPSTQSTPQQTDIDDTNSLYRIALQSQLVDNIPRLWVDTPLAFTPLFDQLGLTANVVCQLLNMGRPTFRRHVEAIRQDEFAARGGLGSPPLWVMTHTIPVFIQSTSDTGRGGGTQMVDYYTDRMIVNVVNRMSNSSHKYVVLNWMQDIIVNYIRFGFAADQYAMQHDPNVSAQLAQLLQENAALKRRTDDLKRDLVMYEMNDERYQ